MSVTLYLYYYYNEMAEILYPYLLQNVSNIVSIKESFLISFLAKKITARQNLRQVRTAQLVNSGIEASLATTNFARKRNNKIDKKCEIMRKR